MPAIKTILYCTDMGEHMRPVLRFTIDMARQHEAKIIMLHVIEPLNSGVLVAFDAYIPKHNAAEMIKDGIKTTLKTMQQRLNNFCDEEKMEHSSDYRLFSKVKAVSGHSAETIVHQAEKLKAELIVVGSHTNPSLNSGFIGSTARRVTQLSKIPVLVIPVYE